MTSGEQLQEPVSLSRGNKSSHSVCACPFNNQQSNSPEFIPNQIFLSTYTTTLHIRQSVDLGCKSNSFSRLRSYAQRNGSKQAKEKQKKRPVHRISVIRGAIGILFSLCPQWEHLFILIIHSIHPSNLTVNPPLSLYPSPIGGKSGVSA